MSFLDTLTELWNTPSVDMSEILREQENGEYLRGVIEGSQIGYELILASILKKYKFEVTFGEDGQLVATRDINTNIYTDSNGNKVNPTFVNGIPTLVKILSGYDVTDDSLATNLSDADDYNKRYVSLDARKTTEDGSDISFMRIIKNDHTKEVIFPSFSQSPAPGITTNKFKQFILTQLSVPSQERMQIVETNDKFQVLFYGEKPEVLQLGGILKNTLENPWSMNMLFLWDSLMRGTKLVEDGNILQIYADGELFTGYPFGFQRSKVAPNDFLVSFSFNFVIKERVPVYTTPLPVSNASQK